MKAVRTTTRRSFLRRVGATAIAGTALALVGGQGAKAQGRTYTGVNDCDTEDSEGYGRGQRSQVTDNDTGPSADRACHGRGSNPSSGTQYNSQEHPNTGCSDSDYGSYADPSGRGLTCAGRTRDRNVPSSPHLSGCTDRDSGSGADSIGNGRHC
jgi:hypothetical protein